jgi:hypothetical protein
MGARNTRIPEAASARVFEDGTTAGNQIQSREPDQEKENSLYCAIPNTRWLLNDNVVQLHYPRDNDGARMNKIIIPLPHRN